MESKGYILGISRELSTNRYTLTIALEGANRSEIETLDNSRPYRLKLSKWSDKRSLDANSYFHVLCDKLRQAAGVSMARMKNELITSYGQIEYIEDGEPLIYKTNAPPEFMQEREEVHMKFVKMSEDGAYFYRVYRGSHTYNSREMAALIEGTVMECKQYDIEVLTPNELKRLEEEWKRHEVSHTN